MACTITFAQEQALKKILTILLLLFCIHAAAQDDSLLQRLIDSVKTESSKKPVAITNDTQKPAPKPSAFKKDTLVPRASFIDTLLHPDTASLFASDSLVADSTIVAAPAPVIRKPVNWLEDTAFQNLLSAPLAHVKANAIVQADADLHKTENRDLLFYALITIILLLAVIRQLFPKYFQNLFRFLFEASFRQKQRREQLMQETLPPLMMNILFVLVGGLFIGLMAYDKQWLKGPFWQISFYSITLLALVYLLKYAVIQMSGLIFNARESASTYSFIVFLVNKIIALALIPLLMLLAFADAGIRQIAITVAGSLVVFMLAFRYIISLTIIRSTLSIHPLHFFVYLCAVELMPMLIIFKLLFRFIG